MEVKVYVLYSLKWSKYYVGVTQDFEKRLNDHNTGRNRYTSGGSPWTLVRLVSCKNRTEAMRLERQIKKRGIRRYLDEN